MSFESFTTKLSLYKNFVIRLMLPLVDCILSPSPYYTRIKTDLGERAQLKTIGVPMDEKDTDGNTVFTLTVEKIQKAYKDACEKVSIFM